jgi:hypothetical protein
LYLHFNIPIRIAQHVRFEDCVISQEQGQEKVAPKMLRDYLALAGRSSRILVGVAIYAMLIHGHKLSRLTGEEISRKGSGNRLAEYSRGNY